MAGAFEEDERRPDHGPRYQDLAKFKVPAGFRGRPGWIVLAWQIVQPSLFACSPQPFYGWRRFLLRLFGAKVGKGVAVRQSARITYPWKVVFGDHCWVGDHAELYSLGPILIEDNAVVSQHSYLCTASHDYEDAAFPLTTKPIIVRSQAWIATDCFIAPGVTIGEGAIVAARSTVLQDVPPGVIVAGHPATFVKDRPLSRAHKTV